MNIVLFDATEVGKPLSRTDRRSAHILNVLKLNIGDQFDAGMIDGPRGKATVLSIGEDSIALRFDLLETLPPPDPIALLVGLPRPQTARRILRDATTLGVASIDFVSTDRAEPGYRQSHLWVSGEWRRHLITGAEQAFTTHLPSVTWSSDLGAAIRNAGAEGCRLALDNYEGTDRLSRLEITPPVTLALGPERGWSASERDLLRANGFAIAHLGQRVLRSETAFVAALTLVRAALKLT